MILGIMLNTHEDEERIIRRYFSDLTAHYTEERLEIRIFHSCHMLALQLEKTDLLDVAIIDITLPGALEGARLIRRKYSGAEIIIIADVSVSPMQYIHPSIRASSLLLRPVTGEWKEAIRDFFDQLLVKNRKENLQNVLRIDSGRETFRIPFGQIYYLEAREKKVFIRMRMEELAINSTMERLSERLPKNFLRCHRSFIVNMDYISQIKLAENMLYLREGLFVPVSRSYKATVKRRLDG